MEQPPTLEEQTTKVYRSGGEAFFSLIEVAGFLGTVFGYCAFCSNVFNDVMKRGFIFPQNFLQGVKGTNFNSGGAIDILYRIYQGCREYLV
jgi:hypothetical protein